MVRLTQQLLRLLFSLVSAICLIAAFFVLLQDIMIYPAFWASRDFPNGRNGREGLPPKVESRFLDSGDGHLIENWHLPAPVEDESPPLAIIFHGNGGTLESTFGFMQMMQSLGYASIAMEYPGYGRSSGWPGEKAILADVDTLWAHIQKKYPRDPQQIIILGESLGGGPAAYLAEKVNPKVLVLLSTYSSIGDVVAEMQFFKYLRPFLWNNFKVAERIRSLKDSCLVLAHGKRDRTIPFSNFERNKAALQEGLPLIEVVDDQAGHGLLRYRAQEFMQAIQSCFQS